MIDPVLGKVDRDIALLNALGLRAVAAVNTHVHADHVSGSFALRARVPGCRSAIAAAAGAAADVCLADGDALAFGGRALRVIATPGHTAGCISLALDTGGAVFTGDALLVRGCGRTDFRALLARAHARARSPRGPTSVRSSRACAPPNDPSPNLGASPHEPTEGGSSAALFASVRGRLFALPAETRVFPGHDYNGHTVTTIAEEVRPPRAASV